MARDAQKQAKDTYNRGVQQYNTSDQRANDMYNKVFSQAEEDRRHPKGIAPVDLAAMDTVSQQSLGGGVGAATGKANQEVAANRNSEGFAPALQETARDAMRIHSDDALKTQLADADLREQHQNRGIAAEHNLFNTENQDVFNSLGLQNDSTNTLIKAGQSGWFQNMVALINAGANVASAVAGMPKAPKAGGSSSGGGDDGGWGSGEPSLCWIARAIYGENDPRWIIARDKLISWSNESLIGKLMLNLYARFGQRISRIPWAVKMLKPAFDSLVEG